MNTMNTGGHSLSLNSSWGSGTITTGGQTNITGGGWFTPDYYVPTVQYYYPSCYHYWTEDKISKSFKIVEALLKKKIIKEPKTVKDFIELVNSISEII